VRGRLPWGTLLVNVSGSFLAGLVLGAVGARAVPDGLELVVVGGFLGGYTTFSTAMYESLRLWEDGHRRLAAANVLAPLVLAVAAVLVGWTLVTRST
jgi:fluoride exporter